MKKDYDLITNVIDFCFNHYDSKTFEHCLRVASYASSNICLDLPGERDDVFVMAMCHDLLEDTDVSVADISEVTGYPEEVVDGILGALTKKKDETYIEYINRLKAFRYSKYPYIIKLADMKDHLTQTETLTDRLKEKYWEALPYLL